MTLSDFLSEIAMAARWAEPGHSCRCAVALLVGGPELGVGLLTGFDDGDAEYHDDGSLLGSRRDSSLDARAWLNGFTLGQRLRDEVVHGATAGGRP